LLPFFGRIKINKNLASAEMKLWNSWSHKPKMVIFHTRKSCGKIKEELKCWKWINGEVKDFSRAFKNKWINFGKKIFFW
jgi:hypothetical protein